MTAAAVTIMTMRSSMTAAAVTIMTTRSIMTAAAVTIMTMRSIMTVAVATIMRITTMTTGNTAPAAAADIIITTIMPMRCSLPGAWRLPRNLPSSLWKIA